MAIKCEHYNHVCVIGLTGDFVGEDVVAARESVEQAIEQKGTIDVVVDLDKAPFIDSDGLEALLWMKRRCEEIFGQVKLIRLDENCRKILEITRLDHRLECHDDLESAVKTLR